MRRGELKLYVIPAAEPGSFDGILLKDAGSEPGMTSYMQVERSHHSKTLATL